MPFLALFDSGVGGLSVAREIRRALPSEDLLYVADTAYCPYGDRPDAEVRERALAVGRYLAGEGAKLIVVACNTATGAALEDLRSAVSVPVVGLEPAVKIAARVTRARPVTACAGKPHSCVTPTSRSAAPRAATISVAAGRRETTRMRRS